jgi:hypothetical protein
LNFILVEKTTDTYNAILFLCEGKIKNKNLEFLEKVEIIGSSTLFVDIVM